MLVSDIKTETRQIIQQTNPSNSSVSDNSLLAWINSCTLYLCSIIATLPKDEFTIPAANTITLDKALLKIDFASIYDGVSVYTPLTTIDYTNFARMKPYYQNEPAKKPTTLVRKDDLTWDLWPLPSAEWLGKNITLVGTTIPADLTLDTQEPPISKAMHPVYPHYCAWKAFLLLNNPERAAAEYATFDGLKKIAMQATTSTTGNLLSFKIQQ